MSNSAGPAAATIQAPGHRRLNLQPYLLILPAATVVVGLLLYPIVQGLLTSFTYLQLLSAVPQKPAGLANYERLLFRDSTFWQSLGVTIVYTALVVTTVMTTALFVAVLMNRAFRGRTVARGVITLPWAFPEVAAVLVWTWLLNQNFGVLNVFARWIPGIDNNLPWLSEPNLALFSVVLATLWKIFPFPSLVLLTALQTIQLELYEAARIDGAGVWQSFRHVTLPGIAPTIGIMTLLLTIWSFRRFTLIFLLTGGGPAGATETLVIKVYNTAFRFFDLSYGAAIAAAGLVVCLCITATYFIAQRRLGMERYS
ncbi:MAG: carbohydrate ABC transporter permease [Chloroflexota bacterium]